VKPNDVNDLLAPKSPVHEEINSYGLGCSVSRPKAIDAEELRKFAAELMTTISSACIKAGAKDIGHIKAYIDHDYGFLHADTLGDPADVTVAGRDGEPINHFKLVVNTVIYGLAKEAVANATEASLKTVCLKFGLQKKLENRRPHES
jgi:hypothetical protein